MTHQTGLSWVFLQFASISLQLVDFSRHWPGFGVWVLIFLGGIALISWTLCVHKPGEFSIRPVPKKEIHLITSGPYRWIRHPMYASSLLVMGSFLMGHFSLLAFSGFIGLVLALVHKMKIEELFLSETFPNYRDYMRISSRLVPGIY
ncbi:MAG: isoprenylcysteine carboxylmethyltransferase family protein [Verrucomicrobia bacterium]|nr:isoprenylcysteine carboxylmethyltransferase family protein [Verrucomicrobiota bacterium]